MAKRKMKKFSEGGWTDEEAENFMRNDVVPKRAYTYSGIMKSGDTSGWTKDELEALKANEEAERPKVKAAPKKVAPTNTSMPDYEPGEAPAKKAMDFDRNGPIGDAVDAAKKLKQRPAVRKSSDATSKRVKLGSGVEGFKKGGAVSASRRGDGIAQRGKTRGRMV